MGADPNWPESEWVEAVYGDRVPLQPGQPISPAAMQEMQQQAAMAQAQAQAQTQAQQRVLSGRGARHLMGGDGSSGRRIKKARRSLPGV